MGSRRPKGPGQARIRLEALEERVVPSLLGQPLFPSDNPWNQNISNAPVAAGSAQIIAHIGASTRLTPNWYTDNPANGSSPLYGMPFNVVHGNSTAKVNVIIDNYPGESDVVPVPIPANAVLEGDFQNGPNPNGGGYNPNQRGDSHLLVWDQDNNIAYELFGVSRPNDPTLFPNTSNVELPKTDTAWHAAQETVWNMSTDTFRALGETSADAAGLSILAGLARPDEGLPASQGGQGVINHALRVTLPSGDINPQYIYPASHMVSTSQGADNLPLGARLRLENNPTVNSIINSMPPESQVLAHAMQQYGLIVADIGSAMYVSGASASVDANNNISQTWDLSDIFATSGLEALNAGDFQVVDLAPVVTGLSASTGSAGSTLTINGQNFSGAAGHLSVFFGNTPASSATVLSDTQLSVVVPNGSGTVAVTVQSGVNETDTFSSNPNANVNAPIFGYGSSPTSAADQFTFSSSAVTLQSIAVTPGNPSVTVGNNPTFTAIGTFSDNSTQALTGVTWSSSNQAVATIGSNGTATTLTAGSTTITATDGTVSGTTTLTVTAAFPTVTSVSPASGPATGGTTVTIKGTGFTGVTGVSFGGKPAASFAFVSATEITAKAPAGTAGQVADITVTTPGGTSATSTADQFTYAAAATYPPPSNLHATPGNGSVTFSFDPVTVPVQYYPYAQLIGSTLYPIYVGFSNPFTITANNQGPLVNGQTYIFEVAITYANGHTSAWSSPISVTVGSTTAAPTITTQPASKKVAVGKPATFSVVATGTGLIYQWQKLVNSAWVNVSSSNTSGFTGANTASFTISATVTGDAGSFRVVVSNAGGAVISKTAKLVVSVTTAPAITQNPSSQTVNAGNIVTFTAAASGSPAPTVQWQVSSHGGPFTSLGVTSTTLSFASTADENGNQYRAVFTNSAGTATTTAATLTVNSPPVITQQPASLTVTLGQTATFSVIANGTGPLGYQWQKLIGGFWVNVDSSNTSSFTGATTASFAITSPVASDAGTYWVVVSNMAGTVDSNSVTLTVSTTVVAPAIVTDPSSQTVAVGSTVTFTASATGSPTPTVQWQVSTGGGPFTDIPGATSTTYSFTATASQNGNQYQAVFTNSGGTATTTAATLTTATGIVLSNGEQLTVEAGQTVSGVTVLPGGYLHVLAGGTDQGSFILGGDESVDAGGKVIGTTVDKSGTTDGDLEVFGVGTGLILNNGYINVDPGGMVTGTTINGDIMYVDGIANNTTIYPAGSCTVIGPAGTMNGTVLNGGTEWIRSGAVSNGTIANNGSVEYVFAGGVANNLTLNNGGTSTMLGTVNGATINPGGAITVSDGASATGAIADNGLLAFDLSGTNVFGGQVSGNGVLEVQGTGKLVVSNALNNAMTVNIGNSSSLELAAAANANIILGYQSTLKLDVSQAFTGTLAATPGYLDVIDLGDVPFVPSVTTVQLVENAAHTQAVLTVSDQASGGPTIHLTILGDFSGSAISSASDGQSPTPGTLINGLS
jgi:autotransporter passenger strand-loop-strand repeat protein